jgi:hypothetical protein
LGAKAERGQILIELVLLSGFLMAFMLMATALSDTAIREQRPGRFSGIGGRK